MMMDVKKRTLLSMPLNYTTHVVPVKTKIEAG